MIDKPSYNESQHEANDYKAVGVDDKKASILVDWLEKENHQKKTTNSPLPSLPSLGKPLSGLGGFAAIYEPHFHQFQKPLLVTTTDGVGTKILLALEHDQLDGIGQDLVAMCANDLFTIGARALGFLDYYATGSLSQTQFKRILSGIQTALQAIECSLMGGETAQLPGLYKNNHFDLAGFMFGMVDKDHILGSSRLKDDDILYCLPSSGFHSNGFSLIRSWLDKAATPPSPQTIKDLLRPTHLYPEIPYLVSQIGVEALHGCAHITGGGITANLKRILPPSSQAHVNYSQLPLNSSMKTFIEEYGCSPWQDFRDIFNLGCGMILAVAKDQRTSFEQALKDLTQPIVEIGHVSMHSSYQNTPEILYHD
ncbi:MAG: phosphoribosylformylglycinamidine cyclo-ligase [Proteobacteria bacterium]|nr:phosphoribosylformylglycinamidine cyclo-ligase [Pseudomonadota bacterium]